MQTKKELKAYLDDRDSNVVQQHVTNIEAGLKKSWDGLHKISVDTGTQFVAKHVQEAVIAQVQTAGWTITYHNGGSDQRDGAWNGRWEVG